MFDTLGILLAKRKEYRRNASMSGAAYAAMKLEKFRQLVRYASKNSPYYQDLIDKHGIDINSCTPDDFPVLTKSALMANFDVIVTDRAISRAGVAEFLTRSTDPNDRFLDSYRVIHTSGSSGEMGYFVYSPRDWARGTSTMARPRLPGSPRLDGKKRQKKGRIRVAYYAAVGGHFAGVSMVSGLGRGFMRFFLESDLHEVNEPIAQTVKRLNEYQPDVLAGYTGALLSLARQQQAGFLHIAPQLVSTAGEGMSNSEKAVLESAFSCAASNGYGSSEFLMMGIETPGGTSMLLYDDEMIYDMQPDCTLITNLFNYTVPMIRYRMADVLSPVANRTFPSLPYPEIEALIGRTEIMPVFVNARGIQDTIHPITIAEIFVAGVQRFQLRWTSSTSFTFLVCLESGLEEAGKARAVADMEQRLLALLVQKQLGNVQVCVRVVDDLPVNPKTRKFQLIVDDRNSGAHESVAKTANS